MKIVITGGLGFVGNQVARQLARNFPNAKITAVGRSSAAAPSKIFKNLEYVSSDLTYKNLSFSWLKGVDCVFHVAAKAGIGGCFNDYYQANFTATQGLLNASKEYGVRQFIYTSTPSVVFTNQNIQGGNESLPYIQSKISPYAYTKAKAEKLVLESNCPGEFQALALRPHLIWGKEDPHLLPRILQKHRNNKLKIVGSGKNRMDITHVSNVAHAHICAFQAMLQNQKLGGKPYFIGQNEPVEIWPWLNEIFKNLELPELTKKISYQSAYSIGLIMEKIWNGFHITSDPPMTRFVASQLAHDHWFSGKAAEHDLNYHPLISMNQAMQDTLPWLRSL